VAAKLHVALTDILDLPMAPLLHRGRRSRRCRLLRGGLHGEEFSLDVPASSESHKLLVSVQANGDVHCARPQVDGVIRLHLSCSVAPDDLKMVVVGLFTGCCDDGASFHHEGKIGVSHEPDEFARVDGSFALNLLNAQLLPRAIVVPPCENAGPIHRDALVIGRCEEEGITSTDDVSGTEERWRP